MTKYFCFQCDFFTFNRTTLVPTGRVRPCSC